MRAKYEENTAHTDIINVGGVEILPQAKAHIIELVTVIIAVMSEISNFSKIKNSE